MAPKGMAYIGMGCMIGQIMSGSLCYLQQLGSMISS